MALLPAGQFARQAACVVQGSCCSSARPRPLRPHVLLMVRASACRSAARLYQSHAAAGATPCHARVPATMQDRKGVLQDPVKVRHNLFAKSHSLGCRYLVTKQAPVLLSTWDGAVGRDLM